MITRAQSDVELIGINPPGLTSFSRYFDHAVGHAVDRAVHRVRAARALSLLIAGLGAGFVWDLAADAVQGQVRLLATGAPLALCVAAYAYRRRRPARRKPAATQQPAAREKAADPAEAADPKRATQPAPAPLDFVPLAAYWTSPERADELRTFLDAVDEVQHRLRETLSFVFGDELTASTRLQDLDVAAAEFGVWSQSDSERWRHCLRLRRNIMAEGVEPTTPTQVREESAWLVAASRRLTERSRPPAHLV